MSSFWRVRARVRLAALFLLLASAALQPAPATAQDSADVYRRLEAQARITVPVMPRLAPGGPQPPLSRIVFPRDSINTSGAATVGDLLAQVPGVYLWRGGGIGRPELPNFRGRGGASVEYYLDGMPYLAVGPDSVTVDPALLPLGLIDRVEVERWPGMLRVHLFTRRHDRVAAASHIVLAAGPNKLAMYRAGLERRFASGFGVGVGADYLENPPPTGGLGQYQNTQFWVQTSYVPSARFGAHIQYLGASPDRDAFSDGAGPVGERYEGGRGELQARAFFGGRADGTGPRIDFVYARASFDSSGIEQSIGQLGAAASARGAAWSARTGAFYRTRWTPLDLSVAASWAPAALLTVGAEGVYRRHEGDRTTRYAGLRGGLTLPAGLVVTGGARLGDEVAAPAIEASPEQKLSEIEGTIGWQQPWIGVAASYARTAAFAPPAYQPFPSIALIEPSGSTKWLTLSGRLAPTQWFTVEGWYSSPSGATPAGLPPRHYSVTGSLRSKFLRTFRSGAFDLKLELGLEGWDAGVLGTDAAGAPVVVPRSTFIRSLVQLQIESFSVFWESRNLGNTQTGYVPGFRVPRYSGFFGIRWGFSN